MKILRFSLVLINKAVARINSLLDNNIMPVRFCILVVCVLTFQLQAAIANDLVLLKTINIANSDSSVSESFDLKDFQNTKAVKVNVTGLGLYNVALEITGVRKDTELYNKIVTNIELQLVDADKKALTNNFPGSLNNTNSINLYFRKLTNTRSFYVLVNLIDESLYDSGVNCVLTISPSTNLLDESRGDFTTAEDLGILELGSEINKNFSTASIFRSSLLHFYKFTINESQYVNIALKSTRLDLTLYNSNFELVEKAGEEIDTILSPGDYFIEISEFSTTRFNYSFSINSIDVKIKPASLKFDFTRTDGSSFSLSNPAYFITNLDGEDKIFSTLNYEKKNISQVTYPVNIGLGSNSQFCKSKKNKFKDVCLSRPFSPRFVANNFDSITPVVTIKQSTNKKTTGTINFTYSTRGFDDVPQAFKGELSSGRFVLNINKNTK